MSETFSDNSRSLALLGLISGRFVFRSCGQFLAILVIESVRKVSGASDYGQKEDQSQVLGSTGFPV